MKDCLLEMPSVRNCAGMFLVYSSSDNEVYGAEPLLCQVSKTYSSLFVFALPHFEHFILTLSIHGLCSSKSGPSGSSKDESTISFLENKAVCSPQSLHFQIGRGHPQNLSREIHQGCFSLIIPKNLFFGCSKKYSTFSAAFTALSPSLSSL